MLKVSQTLCVLGDFQRTSSEASFGDPEEKIIDAKLEGGKTILKSKDRETSHKVKGKHQYEHIQIYR